jgi:hypothetical protein
MVWPIDDGRSTIDDHDGRLLDHNPPLKPRVVRVVVVVESARPHRIQIPGFSSLAGA